MAGEVIVWVALVAVTLLMWILGTLEVGPHHLIYPALIGLAFAKTRFVGRYFMELRKAPVALRRGFDVWVVVVGLFAVTLAAIGS